MAFTPFDGASYTATQQPSSRVAEPLQPVDIKFGQNLKKVLGFTEVTISGTTAGNLLSLVDDNGSSAFAINSTASTGTDTSTILMDLGFKAPSRAISLVGSIENLANPGDTATLTLEASDDGDTFTQLATETIGGNFGTEVFFAPQIGVNFIIRFIRITTAILNTGSGTKTFRLYGLDLQV
tara:strand:- start:780 stop:1322 length:543 start_codon:yes stop_codon:yes gene_type:complete